MIDFDLFQIIPCSAKAIKVIVKVSSQQLHHRGAGNGPSHISATSRNKAQSCSLHGTHSIAPSKCVLNSSELRGTECSHRIVTILNALCSKFEGNIGG